MPGKKNEVPQLTKAEERIMKALWTEEPAFVRDIIARMPEPKPHANTVNTILKILIEKGFVVAEAVGNANRFRPLVSKDDYSRKTVTQVVTSYFNGSFADMVSFFVADRKMDIDELEEILNTLKSKKG